MAIPAHHCGRSRPNAFVCPYSQTCTHSQTLSIRAAILPLLALACLIGCRSPESSEIEAPEPELETIVVDVMTVTEENWPTIVRCQGSLFSDEQSVLGTKMPGRVAEMHVDLGDQVRLGDPIVTLEEEEFLLLVQQAEAQLEQARSAVGLAMSVPLSELSPENSPPVRQERAIWDEVKRNLKRASNLIKENAMSQGEYDQIAAAERVAEARYSAALNSVREKIALIGVRTADLALAKQQLREAVIRSPFDGIVARKDVAPGSFLSAGQAVAVIVRTNPLRFRGTVPERYAQTLQVGQPIKLKIESIAEPKSTKISRISPALDQQSRALSFEANLDNDSSQPMRTGLFAEAEVTIDSEAMSMAIPDSAVIEFAGAQKVWVVVDGVATEREILCGMRRSGLREVIEGLQPGDLVLRDASQGRVAKVSVSKVDAAETISRQEKSAEQAENLRTHSQSQG